MSALPTGWRRACVSAGLAAVLLTAWRSGGAECPYADSAWTGLRAAQRERLLMQPSLEALDEPCLVALLGRRLAWGDSLAGRRAVGHLATYIVVHGSPSGSLLFAALRLGLPERDPAAWREICHDWEQANGPLDAAAGAFRDSGRVAAADSLYAAFEAAGGFAVTQYLEWFTLRNMRRDYAGAAEALCRLSRGQPRLEPLGRGQLSQMLAELDSAETRKALTAYRECCLSQPASDTAGLRLWLARAYAQAGLYRDEIAVVTALESPARPSLDYLLSAARRHYALKRYEDAVAACRAAWARAVTEDTRSLCAGIMYESQARLGRRDSAAAWLARTNLASARSAAQAVVFYQAAGSYARADSLLRTIAPGPVRDTLWIRQLVFQGRADSALRCAAGLQNDRRWRSGGPEARLWRARTALFAGDMVLLGRHLDSLRFDPTWEYAGEVLNYRYRLARFGSDEAALAGWPAFESALFRGQLREAEAAVDRQSCAPANASDFTVRLVREWLGRGEYVEAARVAGAVDPASTPPEQLYYCAEVLYEQGRLDRARELLEQLLLRHPSSIYAAKARLLLARTQS